MEPNGTPVERAIAFLSESQGFAADLADIWPLLDLPSFLDEFHGLPAKVATAIMPFG
jgi:hypothetical protein